MDVSAPASPRSPAATSSLHALFERIARVGDDGTTAAGAGLFAVLGGDVDALDEGTRHMLGTPLRPALRVALIAQPLLAQHPAEVIGAEAAQVVDEVQRHERLAWVLHLAKQLLDHAANRILPQLWPVAQPPGASLKLRHAAVHQ